jgi:hypothetical protein
VDAGATSGCRTSAPRACTAPAATRVARQREPVAVERAVREALADQLGSGAARERDADPLDSHYG